MDKFIFFPTGHEGTELLNDNLDVNVLITRENGNIDLYVCTLFTIQNIQDFVHRDDYHWSSDMIILHDLKISNIIQIISKIIKSNELEAFSFVKRYSSKEECEKDLSGFKLMDI